MTTGTAALAADDGALDEVGHDDLGARGLNAALALADHCAFIGSRGQDAVAIVDIADPAHPRTVGSLPGRRATTARELRTVPDRHLLVVMSYALGAGGVNRFDLYRWDGDCARPAAVGAHDFGGRSPHEFFLWQDPGGARTLLFTTMFSGRPDDLQVVDVTDPSAPRVIGTWSPPLGLLHSIALSADGRLGYLSLWTGGLLVADVSQFTAGQASPRLTLLTPPASRLPAPAGGNVHSAVQMPGRGLLLLTDERYPPACPYGPVRLVDVADPARPRQVSVLGAPENDPTTCRNSPVGTYTSHNPTPVGDLALVTWYSSGLQVFDVGDPARPVRLAEFRPQASEPGQRDRQLGATLTMTWSYPIVRDGLIYVADINQGLSVLRYRGPHQEELERTAFAEGNSNLTAALAPAASPPTTATPALPTATPSVRPSSAPAAVASLRGAAPAAGIAVLALALVTVGLAVVTRKGRVR